ncbi:MAG: adenosylhomocysteinase [Gammaproteobacteria bacterium]|nr:adenosylhomocysteinase [Gammaproteobacteria bacterium]
MIYNSIGTMRQNYFINVAKSVPEITCQLVILTHILPDRPELLAAISKIAPIALVIAIPYSIEEKTFIQLEKQYNFLKLSLEEMNNPEILYHKFIEQIDLETPVIILEIGGYFAPILEQLHSRLGSKLLGVIEDTETGHRQYEKLKAIPCPIVSVARSFLKESEDCLVGSSCVFSTENLIRKSGFLLDGKQILILGFGKIGRGLAQALLRRGQSVSVYDADPSKRILARSEGLKIVEKETALHNADLIFGATGNYSIRESDFKHIKKGAILASCSSKQIEFDMAYIKENYIRADIFDHYTRYSHNGHYFYLLAEGKPVNFLDDAIIGPVLALVQAEIIYAVKTVIDLKGMPGLHEVSSSDRKILADLWLNHFLDPISGTYLNE